MRKRLFVFAAATCFALSTFATPALAEVTSLEDAQTISSDAQENDSDAPADAPVQPDEDVQEDVPVDSGNALPGDSDDASTDDASIVEDDQQADDGEAAADEDNAAPDASLDHKELVANGSADSVVTLAEPNSLQQQINAISGTSTESATLTLGGDFTTDQGLLFTGNSSLPADKRQTFIIDAQNHNITLSGFGIGATNCNVVIQNCPNLTIKAHNHKVPGVFTSACYFGNATFTLDNCTKVLLQNDLAKGSGGHGLSIYNEGSLYIKNHTSFTITDYMTPGDDPEKPDVGGTSGIYIDCDDTSYSKTIGDIIVSDHSTLTVTHCYHNGITANPANITVTNHSVLNVNDNNDDYKGKGGLGCYFGTLTVEKNSTVNANGNTGIGFSIFVHNFDVDGTSEVNSFYNSLYGVTICGEGVLRSGAKLTSEGNGGPGVMVYNYDEDDPDYKGRLTVQKGATLSSCRNYNRGLANANSFTVESGAHVYLNENLECGLDNYPDATTIVKEDAEFVVTKNHNRGIKNGNSDYNEPAILILKSGIITENNKELYMPYHSGGYVRPYDGLNGEGGGIYNEYGTVELYTTAKVYNNHAEDAGDDLYNSNKDTRNNFTIAKLEPGAKWSVLDDDDGIIDDWYEDYAGADKRWSPDNAKNNTVISLTPGTALKAAHGKVAPTPSPKPATPKPAEPTAAPTTASTAAPANNIATATPAPTAQPVVTAAPAPTAQASGVIPQTGDSSSPALFSILTLGSAAAVFALYEKRRKGSKQ